MNEGGNGNGNGNGNGGGEAGVGFVRADKIDLKSIDEQLQRHLSRAWTLEKNKKNHNNTGEEGKNSDREIHISYDWEIDPSKLIIKSVIARGTFGTVHRGFYDGLDIAGLQAVGPH